MLGSLRPADAIDVSIVIPVFNGARVLPGAVSSVLAQDALAWELILVDDGSSDGSLRECSEYARMDPRIRLLANASNLGIAKTLNRGLDAARGEFVLILHQDCRLIGTDWLRRAARLAKARDSDWLVPTRRFDADDMTHSDRCFAIIRDHIGDTQYGEGDHTRNSLFSEVKADLFRRKAITETGGFDERFDGAGGGEDQELAGRFRMRGLAVVQSVELQYQLTSGTSSTTRSQLRKEFEYGSSMQRLVLKTHLGHVRGTRIASLDRRLANRIQGEAWILALVLGVTAILLSARVGLLPLLTLAPAARMGLLGARGLRWRRLFRLSGYELLLVPVLGIAADIAYSLGLISPFKPSHRQSSPVSMRGPTTQIRGSDPRIGASPDKTMPEGTKFGLANRPKDEQAAAFRLGTRHARGGHVLPNYVVGWSLAYSITVGTFVALFYFMDINNLRDFLLAGSYYYVSQNPYAHLSFAPPLNFAIVALPSYLLYQAGDSSFILATTYIKLIQLAASVGSAVLVYRIALRLETTSDNSRAAFLGFLLSPVMFFVNYVYVEQDILGIFFVLLAIYLYTDSLKSGRIIPVMQIVASLLLWYSIYLYYLPVLLIPTLLVFQRTWRNAAETCAALAVGFLFFYIPVTSLHVWDLFPNILGTVSSGTVNTVPVYSILNLFGPGYNAPYTALEGHLNTLFTMLFIFLALIVPVLFKLARHNPIHSMLVTLSLALMLLQIYNGDEVLWILPFAIIALTMASKYRRLLWMFAVQAYAFPTILLFNMWGAPGPGAGTGIFYLGYFQFHDPIQIYALFQNPAGVSKLLDLLEFISLLLISLFASIVPKPAPGASLVGNPRKQSLRTQPIETTEVDPAPPTHSWKSGRSVSVHLHLRPLPRASSIAMMSGIFVIFLLTLQNYSIVGSPTISVSGSDQFPLALFQSYPVMNSKLSYTLENNGRNLVVEPSSALLPGPLAFSRNVTGEDFRLNLGASALEPPPSTFAVPILQANHETIRLENSVVLTKNTSILVPRFTWNSTLSMRSDAAFGNGQPLPTYFLNGTGMLEFSLSSNGSTPTLDYFMFQENSERYVQNVVYLLQAGSLSIELFGTPLSYEIGVQVAPGAPWGYLPVSTAIPLSRWNLATFLLRPHSVTIGLNGQDLGSPGYVWNGTGHPNLYVGKFGNWTGADRRYAFDGNSTAVFEANGALSTARSLLLTSGPANYTDNAWVCVEVGARCSLSSFAGDHLLVADLNYTTSSIDATNSTPLVPSISQNVSPIALGNPLLYHFAAVPTYSFNGTSLLAYPLNLSALSGKEDYFLFEPATVNFLQDIVFLIQLGNTSAELYEVAGTYTVGVQSSGQSPWKYTTLDRNITNPSWNAAGLLFNETGFKLMLDGVDVGYVSFGGNSSKSGFLYLGKFGNWGGANEKYAFAGLMTTALTSVGPYGLRQTPVITLVHESPGASTWESWHYEGEGINVDYDSGRLTIAAGSSSISLASRSLTITFGRLSSASTPLVFSTLSLYIGLQGGQGLLVNIVLITVVAPSYLCCCAVICPRPNRRNQKGAR